MLRISNVPSVTAAVMEETVDSDSFADVMKTPSMFLYDASVTHGTCESDKSTDTVAPWAVEKKTGKCNAVVDNSCCLNGNMEPFLR